MPELKIGYQGPLYNPWYDWATRKYASYAFLLGSRDGYFGNSEAAFVRELQRRLGIVQDGIFGDRTAAAAGYVWPGASTPPVVVQRRPIWLYSAPGSGAPWWLGPSFDLGQMVAGAGFNGPGRESLRIQHQPIGYPIGGYLGLMGGDPALSYLDVINAQKVELGRLLRENPDVQHALAARRRVRAEGGYTPVDVELWFSGYSQSADGMREAILALFGDGGEFALIRDRINGLLLFGDPATPGTGIARKTFPAWLERLVVDINVANDFYAVARDKIRPLFYEWFIKAETEIPFVVYSAQIIIPALLKLIAPFLSGFGNPLALPILTGATGVSGGLLNSVLGGMATTSQKPNPELVELLSVQGLLTSLPDLLGLMQALPGLQAHGAYHLPLPDFGGRTGPQVAYDHIAGYRR